MSPQVESAQLKLGTKEEINVEANKILENAKNDDDVLFATSLKQIANADNKDLSLDYSKSAQKLSSDKEQKILESAKKVLPENQLEDFKAYIKEQGKDPENIDKDTLEDIYSKYFEAEHKQLANVVSSNGAEGVQVVRNSDEVVAKEVLDTVAEKVNKGELKDTASAKVSKEDKSKSNTNTPTSSQGGVVSSKNVAKASDEPVTKTKQGKLSDTGLGDTSTAPFAMVSLALALMLAKRKMDLKKSEK